MSEAKEPLSVYPFLTAILDQMAGIAWIKLGLRPDPVTGDLQSDLDEAKVAIDVATQLADAVRPKLDDADRREVDNLIANLRINYVERTKS